MMYLVFLRRATDLPHVMAHLGKIAFGIAIMFALVVLINRLALRSGKSGQSKKPNPNRFHRQKRR